MTRRMQCAKMAHHARGVASAGAEEREQVIAGVSIRRSLGYERV